MCPAGGDRSAHDAPDSSRQECCPTENDSVPLRVTSGKEEDAMVGVDEEMSHIIATVSVSRTCKHLRSVWWRCGLNATQLRTSWLTIWNKKPSQDSFKRHIVPTELFLFSSLYFPVLRFKNTVFQLTSQPPFPFPPQFLWPFLPQNLPHSSTLAISGGEDHPPWPVGQSRSRNPDA